MKSRVSCPWFRRVAILVAACRLQGLTFGYWQDAGTDCAVQDGEYQVPAKCNGDHLWACFWCQRLASRSIAVPVRYMRGTEPTGR